ncbi:MAG: Gfo/Idh/MocA family protein [Lautropia sp.]
MKRFVMVGCGGFSRRYHVPTLLADPRVRLVGIFDPYPAPDVRALAGTSGASLVDRLDDLPDADAALVTTPHTLHAEHAAWTLGRGMATLVDKPFVMKTSDARALSRAASERGLVNGVGFNRRLDVGCVKAKAMIAAGRIGPVRLVQTVQLGYEAGGWFLRPELGGGGAYTGRATHMADIVPWMLGRRPRVVRSRLRPGEPGRVDHGGFIDLAFDDVECQMHCIDQGLHMWDEIRLFGDSGLIELRRPSTLPTGWALTLSDANSTVLEHLPAEAGAGWITTNFIDALCGVGEVACTFADAVLSVEIIEAAFGSAARLAQGDTHAVTLADG